jgi:hypothetical protein
VIKKVDGEDYHSIDSEAEAEDGASFKSLGDLGWKRKLVSSLAW